MKIYNPAFDPPNGPTQDDIGSACLDPTFITGSGQDWWQIEYLTPNCCPTDTVTLSISLNGSPIHLVNEIV